ncbi:MAG: ribosome biogenesis GTPase Der [bacterium]|nr:ribosome biogenesis GTPase Der [bacterium]
MLPIVAIIGKPNVGKSTLFNRLVGYRKAITSPTPGTTRDRHYAEIGGRKPYLLIDTGGIESKAEGVIEESILAQAKLAIAEADLIVFLIDAKEAVTREDSHVASLLRKSGKKVISIASKCDSGQEDLSDILRLGFGQPLMLSATHKIGVEELQKLIGKNIPKGKHTKVKDEKKIRLAILGRPNTGKSSLINKIIGSEKLIVSDIQGTTVDSTDVDFEFEEKTFTLVDTAGIRRRGKIGKGIEKYSFLRSLQAHEQADVCVLLIDGKEGVTSQDQHVADYILQSYSGLILAINKLDLMESGEEARVSFLNHLHHKFEFVPWAPVVFISAKTGKNMEKILELAKEIKESRAQRIATSRMNRWLEMVVMKHFPTGTGVKVPKLFYITQVDVNPPHFVVQVNNEEYFHFSYIRYLENQLRESFGFNGTAIKFQFRNKPVRKDKKGPTPRKWGKA